jgi:hypothetical protein
MVVEVEGERLEVFDVHTHMVGGHLFQESTGMRKFLGKDLISGMNEAGVDEAVTFSAAQPSTDYSEANKTIVGEMKKYPKRIFGFARVNPNFGSETTTQIIDTYVGKYGMFGIKLHSWRDGFEIGSRPLVGPVFEGAKKYGVPILVHTGEYLPSPTVVADIASEYPEVQVICAHLGYWHWWEDAIIAARKQDNIFLDTAAVVGWTHPLNMAIKKAGAHKVLFGSDYPYQPLVKEVEVITRFCEATVDEMRLILAENAKRLLRIQ